MPYNWYLLPSTKEIISAKYIKTSISAQATHEQSFIMITDKDQKLHTAVYETKLFGL